MKLHLHSITRSGAKQRDNSTLFHFDVKSDIDIFIRNVNVVCVKDAEYKYLLSSRYSIAYYNNTLAVIIPLLATWPCGLISRH